MQALVRNDLPDLLDRTAAALPARGGDVPLVVDLDGTLVRTDTLHEATIQLAARSPLAALALPAWLWSGKAALKHRIAQRTRLDAASLPFNDELLAWLREERAAGRRLVLCTASDGSVAHAVADACGLFDEVVASDGVVNLGGEHKARALVARFGEGGFDYAGNAHTDLQVWAHARHAIVVNAAAGVAEAARRTGRVQREFAPRPQGFAQLARAVRWHQWLKNLLVFAPLVAAHQLGNVAAWRDVLLAFVAFCLCASSVYIANDLLDLESDRRHPRKRHRPFAAGTLSVATGVLLAPVLAVASGLVALALRAEFFAWLAGYFVLTAAYSWGLKRVVLVDCLTLAALYTIRVLAGSAAAGLELSFWLIAFSGFLFLSLAYVKRYAELQSSAAAGEHRVHGRAYVTSDAPLVQGLGIVSGYASVVVLALYLNSEAVMRLYAAPGVVWGTVPIMVWWVSWMWLRAFRGEMHDDPLVFAFRDRASLVAGALFGLVLWLGAVGWPR